MALPPVVGLPVRNERRADEPHRLVINRSYVRALEVAGAAPLLIPLVGDTALLDPLLDACDGLCLPGGPDVAPELYGEAEREGRGVEPDGEVDACELHLLRRALAGGLPTLAICRGLQLLNVALGGSLWQDLGGELPGALSHRGGDSRADVSHPVAVEEGSRLFSATGRTTVDVNSLHHQGLRRLAPPLRVTGRSPDGLVEAAEVRGAGFAMGLQCHPEELVEDHPWALRLFSDFVDAAGAGAEARRAASSPPPRGGGV